MVSGTDFAEIPADALRLSWGDVERQSVQLGEMIQAHCNETGERFDRMLVMPRGGYYPANILAQKLGFAATGMLHACIGSYERGASERSDHFALGQMPSPEEVQGKNILIIDDVCDTGHTLKFIADLLEVAGAGLVRTGVLHYKSARNEVDFKPDWHTEETDEWIVYPWEVFEEQDKAVQVRR